MTPTELDANRKAAYELLIMYLENIDDINRAKTNVTLMMEMNLVVQSTIWAMNTGLLQTIFAKVPVLRKLMLGIVNGAYAKEFPG